MIKQLPILLALLAWPVTTQAEEQPPLNLGFTSLFNGKDLSHWTDVNTSPDTWSVKDGLLVCSGQPIGVMRSKKQYENFILVHSHPIAA